MRGHKSIFIRTDRGIKTPADLRGRKVATVGYSSSGLTHVRGVLQEEYGVKPEEIEWISTQKDSAANQEGQDAFELAKKTQNPISDLISLPFQNNINFGVGPENVTQYVLNVQPVVPFAVSERWNIVTRTIVPIINQPSPAPGVSSAFGLGLVSGLRSDHYRRLGEWQWRRVDGSNRCWRRQSLQSWQTADQYAAERLLQCGEAYRRS